MRKQKGCRFMEKKKSIFKRWWFWVIVVVVIVGIASAGGGSKEDDGKGNEAVATEENKEKSGDKKQEEKEKSKEVTEATVEEQTLLEQDGVKITLKELDNDALMGAELKLLIENNSEQNLTVQANNVSVNGIMIESVFSCDVAAGKSANDGITLLSSDLEQAGIENIQNVELNFHIFDTESWDTVLDSDTIYIATSLDGTEEQNVDDSGVVLLEQDGIKITVKEADSEESFWGADIYIYVENNTDKNVTVQASSVSLNGFMVEPYFSCDVAAGKKAYDTITFMESDLEENGIDSISDMEISFHVFNTESWDTIFDTEALAVSFTE